MAISFKKFGIFVSGFVSWANLKLVFGSRIAKFISLIPIFGFLVIYNENLKTYFSFESVESKCGLVPSIPFFENRIDIFYLGMVVLGLASILFQVFAPSIVKVYPGVDEYARARVAAGRYDIVGTWTSLAKRCQQETSAQVSRLRKTIGSNHRSKRRILLNNYCSIRFPLAAYTYIIVIGEQIYRNTVVEPEKFDPLFVRFVGNTVLKFRKFIDDKDRIGKVEFVNDFGVTMIKARFVSDTVLLRDSIAYDSFSMEYYLENFNYFLVRMFIGFLLVLGLSLVAIPTVMTAVYAMDKFCA